jgi:hypothetical protein
MADKGKTESKKKSGKDKEQKTNRKNKRARDSDPHKELPDEISNSDSFEGGELNVSHVGYIEVKSKGKFKAHYCIVIGGTFYWFKNNMVRTSKMFCTEGVFLLLLQIAV